MQKIFKNKIVLTLLILLGGVIAGAVLLIGVYLLPTNTMSQRVKESVAFFDEEGSYPALLGSNKSGTLDNFTDALMLLSAVYDKKENAVREAMLVNHYRAATKHVTDPIEDMKNYYYNLDFNEVVSYSRYWHGYLVFLKPALLVFNYFNLRTINSFIQPLLLIMIGILLYKKKNIFYHICYQSLC